MALELTYAEIDDTNKNYQDDDINPLDVGIDTSNQSITYANNIVVNENQMANPFIVGLNGGNISEYPTHHIWTYPHIIILTLKDDVIFTEENMKHFFSPLFNIAFMNMSKYINCMRVSVNILNNRYFYKRANIIKDNVLINFFPNEHFNTSEIVISMIDMPRNILTNIFTPINNLENLLTTVKIYKHYNKYFDDNLQNKINNIPTINYWSNKKHCNINITELFTLRDFQSKKDSKFIMICKPTDINAVADTDGDTVAYPQRIKNKDNFCDIGVSIKKNKMGFFATPTTKTDYKNIVTELFKNINSQKYQYLLANAVLISKDYTDTVINNSYVLDIIKPLIDKYPGAFKYSIGYAWLNLYLEETLYTVKSKKNHRHVFDINTASKLPVFPFTMEDIKQNPYLPLMIDDKQINIMNNCLPINIIKNYDGYGITDLTTFKKRLNIFITQNSEKDIFEGIDWNKFALSGSIIPACLQKKSPLLDVLMKKYNDENIAFNEFIMQYYPTSDIDIMCNCKSFFDFLDEGQKVFDIIKHNLELSNTKEDSSIETIKSVAISVTKQFFTDTLDDFNTKHNIKWSLQEYIDNMNDDKFKHYLYDIYVLNKTASIQEFTNNNLITNSLRAEYAKVIPFDRLSLYYVDYNLESIKYLRETETVLHRNDFLPVDKNVDTKNNIRIIKFSENFRFKFNFSKIKRQIEYFKIFGEDFFDVVARFHLPCVRAYYQGDNVYMLPSCISAMMTGINIEYKYFAGIRNPVEIINKYMQRGYGIILNTEEIKQFKEFNMKLEDNNSFKIINEEDNTITGIRNINHKTFNINTEVITKYKYITEQDLIEYYGKNKLIDALKFTTINSSGDINKCYPSYFELYYNTS